MPEEKSIQQSSAVRSAFHSNIEHLFQTEWPGGQIALYYTHEDSEREANLLTLALLDEKRQTFYEVRFRSGRVTDCRLFTQDRFNHGYRFEAFQHKYLNRLKDLLIPEWQLKLWALFLPGEQALDRAVAPEEAGNKGLKIQNQYL